MSTTRIDLPLSLIFNNSIIKFYTDKSLFIPDCNGEVSMKKTDNVKLFLIVSYHWNRDM